VGGAAEQVQALLSAPLTLTADLQEFDAEGWPHAVRRTWAVDQATLASWLTLSRTTEGDAEGVAVGLDEERIAAFVADLGRQLERSPREGRFDYAPATGTLTVLSPRADRLLPRPEQALQAILTACLQPGARMSRCRFAISRPAWRARIWRRCCR
jgi:hypothetical protein